jgi:hypothetical protein
MSIDNKKGWYSAPVVVGVIFVAVLVVISIRFFSQARSHNDNQIAQQIQQLAGIFNRINDCCQITGFRYQRNYINFLTVARFEGSQIGSMNLAHPERWAGPYLDQNITIEGREYQIVTTKKGYFIIPGDGVKLANGQIIGKTLIINRESDIESLMSDSKALLSTHGQPLAARIETVEAIMSDAALLEESSDLEY